MTGTDLDDGMLLPHARSFASVMNSFTQMYSTRFDEAMRDGRENALAMRRDAYYEGLLQERTAPTLALDWTLMTDDPKSAVQRTVADGLSRIIRATPYLSRVIDSITEAAWYGRAGSQVKWQRTGQGWQVARHVPINGDKIHYQHDGTPCVMLNPSVRDRYESMVPGSTINTDAGGHALRLIREDWRQQFIIHQFRVRDADYFAADQAGAVGGVGLRHMAYWSAWMRTEALTWMLSFMESVGMMDMLIFNYEEGNAASKAAAQKNADTVSGKVALLNPRRAGTGYPAVESISASPAGVTALQGLIQGYYERHIERLFVGQTLSSSSEGNGLGGSGVASFHRDTKFQLIKADVQSRDETLTRELVAVAQKLNYPWSVGLFGVRWKSALPDPEAKEKLEAGAKLVQMGVSVKADELRAAAGYTRPLETDETVGGPQDPQQPPPEEGADMFERGQLTAQTIYEWRPHTIKSGPRKGQSAWKESNTGEIRDSKPVEVRAREVGQTARKAVSSASGFMKRLKAGGKAASAAIREDMSATITGKALLKAGGATKVAVGLVHHAAMYAMHKSQELAVEAAKARGLDDGQAKRLGHVLFAADFLGGYASGGAMAAVMGPVGFKVGSFVPTASVAYLAYSTARNPQATLKAAKTVLNRMVGRERPIHHARPSLSRKSIVLALADRMKLEDFERWSALWHACLGRFKGDVARSIDRADEAYESWASEGDKTDYEWKPHIIQRGKRKGQSAWKESESGRIADKKPEERMSQVPVQGVIVGRSKPGPEADKAKAAAIAILESKENLGIEGLKDLAGHLAKMPVRELKLLNQKHALKHGRVKREHVESLVSFASSMGSGSKSNRENEDGSTSKTVSGTDAEASGSVEGQDSEAGNEGDAEVGQGEAASDGEAASESVPAKIDKVNTRINRFRDLFRSRGQNDIAGWLDRLQSHVNDVGVEDALVSMGGTSLKKSKSDGDLQYEGGWDKDAFEHHESGYHLASFCESYLNRVGITMTHQAYDPTVPTISSASPSYGGSSEGAKGSFLVKDPELEHKLAEAQALPGLEASEDLNKIMGKSVTHLTPDMVDKLDDKYGKGKWIVKAYGDDAASGYGVFFPQRIEQIRRNAQDAIWNAGSEIAKYGFKFERDDDKKVIGIRHSRGDVYQFGSTKYRDTIGGEVRKWADIAREAAQEEQGAMLPGGGKQFMAQPAFNVVGVTEADRAAGKLIAPGEGRVHVVTRNGKAELVPSSTWIKGESLPVVFENEETRAMAKAAVDAINALPESERKGQIYAPDIVKTDTGYRVVEANPANNTGSSGYLGNNPLIIDAYVSHLTGREPSHVTFIKKLLTDKKRKA